MCAIVSVNSSPPIIKQGQFYPSKPCAKLPTPLSIVLWKGHAMARLLLELQALTLFVDLLSMNHKKSKITLHTHRPLSMERRSSFRLHSKESDSSIRHKPQLTLMYFLGFSKYSKSVSSPHVIPLFLLAALYEYPSACPD